MRYTILPLAFLGTIVLTRPVHAQTKTDRAEVRWGAELNEKKDGDFGIVYHETEDHVYFSNWKKKELYITKMDRDLKVEYDRLVPLEINDEEHGLERIVFLGDQVVVFTSVYDKKDERTTLYKRVFNEADMRPQGGPEKIHQVRAEGRKNTGGFNVYTSPDRERMLVRTFKPYEKEAREQFDLRLYDGDLQLLSERTVDLPYSGDKFVTESVLLDNDGTVMVLGIVYDEKQEARANRKKGDATYTYHLLVLPPDASAPEDHVIDVREKFLQDMTFAMGETGDIVCGGFYGNTNEWNIRGAYFLKLDRGTKAISHQSFKEFDNDFITSYMTEKEAKQAEKRAEKREEDLQMYNFDLDEIVLRDDGGAVMVGEQSYTYVSCYTDNNGNRYCNTYYVNNDIVVVNIDPNGEIEWARKVPKRQHAGTPIYSSYGMSVVGNKIYFVFNDSGKNLFLKEGDRIDDFELKGKDALVTLATVEADGTVHREALLAPDRQDAILRPMACTQVADDRMFIYATRKNDYQYGYITFQ